MSLRLKILVASVVLIVAYSYWSAYPGFGGVQILPLGAQGSLQTSIGWLVRLAFLGGLFYLLRSLRSRKSEVNNHAVLIKIPLPTGGSADHLYTLEDKLAAAIESGGTGEYDGNEIGEGTFTIFTYGPDADQLLATIAATLGSADLPPESLAIIRYGKPGAKERSVPLAGLIKSVN